MSTVNTMQKYISVGELSVGFSENIIEPTLDLVGKEFNFFMIQERKRTYLFCITKRLNGQI